MQPTSLIRHPTARWVAWLAAAVAVAVLVLGMTRGPVLAVPAVTSLHQAPPIQWDDAEFLEDEEECAELGLDAGEVLWHFVLVQTSASSATLHATFASGDISVGSYKKTGSTLHFAIPTGEDTLLGAHVDAAGRWLNLSHVCAGPPHTTTTTTSTTSTSTTTSGSTTTDH